MSIPLSVIIPTFNEESLIGQVVQQVIARLKEAQVEAEVLVVDDGSTDNSALEARKGGAVVLSHPQNMGYGAALKTGIRKCQGEIVLFLDADGQHNDEDMLKIYHKLNNDSVLDMVVGARDNASQQVKSRAPGKKLLHVVANYLARTNIPDLNSGLRAIRTKLALKYLAILPNTFSFTTTITLAFFKDGLNVCYLPITTVKRSGSKSTVKFFRDGFRTLLLIFRTMMLFSPLRIFLPMSLFFLILAILDLLFETLVVNQRISVSDTFILLSVSAILIFFFGLLADQLANIRRELK